MRIKATDSLPLSPASTERRQSDLARKYSLSTRRETFNYLGTRLIPITRRHGRCSIIFNNVNVFYYILFDSKLFKRYPVSDGYKV